MKNAYKIYVGKPSGKEPSTQVKWVAKDYAQARMWTTFMWLW